VEKGYAATRVEEVAARAGVSKGTLFLYFPSKEDLFKAVVRESIVGRFAEWSTQMDEFAGSTDEMLRACYQVWWERIGSTRASGITKLMLCEAGNFPEIAQFYQREVIEPAQHADSPCAGSAAWPRVSFAQSTRCTRCTASLRR
jgi:AcrR family transcriptional regulator